jgi:hypothetical protein
MAGCAGQQTCEGAASRADLKDCILRKIAKSGYDRATRICIYQKVLTKPWVLLHVGMMHEGGQSKSG